MMSSVTVKSYNYSKLVCCYGPDRGANFTVQWNPSANAFKLVFGGGHNCLNAHSIMREQLEGELNRNRNLVQLITMLNDTYQPLLSISKLPTIPQLCVHSMRPQVPVQTFTVIAESVSTMRVAYLGLYCLEIKFRGGGLVTLRDAAYSRFDRTSVVNEFTPTPGLKALLSKYVDETVVLRRRSQSEDDNPPSPVTQETGEGFLAVRPSPGSPAQRAAQLSSVQEPTGLRFHPPPLTPPSNPHTPASPAIAQGGGGGGHQNYSSSPATSFNLASPPSLPTTINPSPVLPHPSPGGSGLLANSPSNPLHVPSPMPISSPGPAAVPLGHSPATSLIGHSGHTDGSPFTTGGMTSPGASNWPGSPSMPRPSPRPGQSPHLSMHSPDTKPQYSSSSRVLPPKSWAGAVPTLINHEALEVLCTPTHHPHGLPMLELAPLERFLGCVYMRRQLQRFIQTEDCMTPVQTTEPGVVQFKVETLQCRVILNPQHLQSLHLSVTPEPAAQDQWTAEELQIIEKFFETKAASPPYKPNALCSFGRVLNLPINILKDFVNIMKLELMPGLVQQQQLKWNVQWCLRTPPAATHMLPTGTPAVLVCRQKILFFLQLSRAGYSDSVGIVLPLVYDLSNNVTQLAEKRDPGASGITAAAGHQLKRFMEMPPMHSECTLFPAVRDLLANLTLPSEPPQVVSSPGMMGGGGPMQSPASMMHSPIQYGAQMGPMAPHPQQMQIPPPQ